MAILDEPSDNQDERSPLKKDLEINTTTSSAALATAPPPYTSIPTPSPNPIPSPQDIVAVIPQTDSQSHHAILVHRRSPIRRFLLAFAVAWLVLLLWSALMHSFKKARHFISIGRNHNYEYEVETSHLWQLQKGVDDTDRVLPIQYPPIQLPQTTG